MTSCQAFWLRGLAQNVYFADHLSGYLEIRVFSESSKLFLWWKLIRVLMYLCVWNFVYFTHSYSFIKCSPHWQEWSSICRCAWPRVLLIDACPLARFRSPLPRLMYCNGFGQLRPASYKRGAAWTGRGRCGPCWAWLLNPRRQGMHDGTRTHWKLWLGSHVLKLAVLKQS